METNAESAKGTGKYLSALAAWGLSFGYAVGWGAFVMPGTSFLPGAGPLGTLLGFLVGGVVMLVIAWNYHTLVSRWPCCRFQTGIHHGRNTSNLS